ncbi:hypothetical protein ABH15_09975 [Methanoculleus taiwanensis]|uniref:Uncharacterized protein n=1 Tax=Methanoculleus taiwanensis TaxID=1550565 RepID=A0A498H0R1_9EURY|nr:hypothetical protein [Methanoculleus taiwanensis]RXE56402.1 hypothetical protein ABH15_09975 [Methanoculleus taiwanensis]
MIDAINNESSEGGNGSAVHLTVTVRDAEGRIVSEECKDNDLYLLNWGALIAGVLKEAISTSYAQRFKGHDLNGDSYTTGGGFWGSPDNSQEDGGGWDNTGRIQFGVSSTPPTIYDFALGNYTAEVQPNAPVILNDGNTIKIVFTGTLSFENSITLSEVAYKVKEPHARVYCILTRDIFTPVTVPAGGSITVQFEYWLNGMPS